MKRTSTRRLEHLRSANASAVGFTLGVWITGNPISTDPSPNVTPPAANRILTMRERAGAIWQPNSGFIRLVAIGGTSVTYQGWQYEALRGVWQTVGGARAITLATTNLDLMGNTIQSIQPGTQVFVQVTAVSGTVTALGYGTL